MKKCLRVFLGLALLTSVSLAGIAPASTQASCGPCDTDIGEEFSFNFNPNGRRHHGTAFYPKENSEQQAYVTISNLSGGPIWVRVRNGNTVGAIWTQTKRIDSNQINEKIALNYRQSISSAPPGSLYCLEVQLATDAPATSVSGTFTP